MRYTSYKLTTLSRDIRVHPIWVTFRMIHLPDVQPAQFTLKYMYTVSQKTRVLWLAITSTNIVRFW